MTYQTFRPTSLPYRTDAHSAQFGDTTAAPDPTFGGSGNLADDVDSTWVSMSMSPTVRTSAVVAVDFDAIPGLIIPAGSSPVMFGMMMRVQFTGSDADWSSASPVIYLLSGSSTLVSLNTPWDIATTGPDFVTYTTPNNYYGMYDTGAAIKSGPFTLAWNVQAGPTIVSTDEWITAEVALMFDVGAPPTHAPPLRQYPRSDGLGASSARRVWPPSRSLQRSNRRVGGYE